MLALFNAIETLQKRLRDTGIDSVVIGGVAVGLWGDPRATRDADLKVLLGREDSDRLLAVLMPDYPPLLADPRQALRQQAMVFVKSPEGVRLDLLLADTPYDVLAVQRGRSIDVQPGVMLRVCSPEDLLIYKLISTRPRDHEDARGIVLRQGKKLDDHYILDWLRQFEQALDDSTLVAEYKQLRRAATRGR